MLPASPRKGVIIPWTWTDHPSRSAHQMAATAVQAACRATVDNRRRKVAGRADADGAEVGVVAHDPKALQDRHPSKPAAKECNSARKLKPAVSGQMPAPASGRATVSAGVAGAAVEAAVAQVPSPSRRLRFKRKRRKARFLRITSR